MTVDTQTLAIITKSLRSALRGEVITASDAGYDEVRRVWNGAIDRYPAIIACCTSTADVVEAVQIARHHDIEVSIRGGGHQISGGAVIDDGLVIDLSPMRRVAVDPSSRTAIVASGARWGDVDRATQAHDLATTGGEVSVTGVAGLTLGGGMGVLQRAFGLACDNLRAIEIVTADGVVRRASPNEHADLLWAAKGGGRGLGVVTSFEFDLHPLGPDVAIAQYAFAMDEAHSVARRFRELADTAPETVSPQLLFWSVPPDPELPAEFHGMPVVMVVGVYAGDPAEAAPVLAPFAELGTPILDLSATMPYADAQAAVDDLFPEGGRYFFKAHFANELTDEALDEIVKAGESRPTPQSLIAVRHLGGAIDRVGPDESAYAHRGARFNVSFDAAWTDPVDDDRAVGWARSSFAAFGPHATGGVYINFAGFDGEPDVTVADLYGKQTRLDEVRRSYDPDGFFSGAAARR